MIITMKRENIIKVMNDKRMYKITNQRLKLKFSKKKEEH